MQNTGKNNSCCQGHCFIKNVDGFKNALRDVEKEPNKYFARFSGLRMEVNEEMEVLKEMLEQSADL